MGSKLPLIRCAPRLAARLSLLGVLAAATPAAAPAAEPVGTRDLALADSIAPAAAPAIATRDSARRALAARDSAGASWRRRHPWPPWWVLPEIAQGPGPPVYCGPPESLALAVAGAPAAEDGHVAQVRAGFTPENRLYATLRVALRLIDPFVGIAVALLLLVSGFSAWLRDLAERGSRSRYGRALIYVALYTVVVGLLTLPLAWFQGWALEHRFRLSNQTLPDWLLDQLKAGMFQIGFLGVVPLLALATWAIERWPRTWWAWFSIASVPLVAAATWLVPLVVEPAFNTFRPLADQGLEREVLALADRAGIPHSHVFEADRSAQTRKLNAYVTGIGSSHRIVLWDTAVQGFRRDELLFVTGHEIGHYRLRHVEQAVVLQSVLSTFGLLIAWALARWAVRRHGPAWGLRSVHDLAALPLLVMILTVLSTAGEPLANAWSRRIERDADVYGLELTRLNDAAARAFVTMASHNRSDPDPPEVLRLLLYSHPPLVDRIRLAESYRPWERGDPNRMFRGEAP